VSIIFMTNPAPKMPSLPDTPEFRARLAEIIAEVCRCDPEPLLRDEPFTAAAPEFDSLAVLEILLEVETTYHIETDDMVPVNPEVGSQEILNIFPQNLSEFVAYTQKVASRVQQREEALANASLEEAMRARQAERLERGRQRMTSGRPADTGPADTEPSGQIPARLEDAGEDTKPGP
jgi:acyl carrier protein